MWGFELEFRDPQIGLSLCSGTGSEDNESSAAVPGGGAPAASGDHDEISDTEVEESEERAIIYEI